MMGLGSMFKHALSDLGKLGDDLVHHPDQFLGDAGHMLKRAWDLNFGDGSIPGQNPAQIYTWFTEGADPQLSGYKSAQHNLHTIGTSYTSHAQAVTIAKNKLNGGWTGPAASAAQAALAPAMEHADHISGNLDKASGIANQQVDSFSDTRNKVVKLPEKAPQGGGLATLSPAGMITGAAADANVAQYQSDGHANQAAYGGYSGATSPQASGLPTDQFQQQGGPDTSVDPGKDGGGGGGNHSFNYSGGGGDSGGPNGGPGGTQTSSVAPPPSFGSGGGGGGTPNYPGPGGPGSPLPGQGGFTGDGNLPSRPSGTVPPGFSSGPSGGSNSGMNALGPLAAGGGGAGSGSGGSSGRNGSWGSRGSALRGGGAGGGSESEGGPGKGAAAGAKESGPAGARAAAAAAEAERLGGKPGASGAPGAGGRGAKKEEDKEHKTASYLIHEGHGDEIVGDLPMTAPPVIGE